MKKLIFTSAFLLLSSFAIYAQKLIITEVDAAKNSYFDNAATQTLGMKMDLTLSGKTLTVKIENQPEIILTQLSDQYFEGERKTEAGLEKFSIKLKLVNAVVTDAEFTGSVIANNEEQKKEWWTVTARNSAIVPVVNNF